MRKLPWIIQVSPIPSHGSSKARTFPAIVRGRCDCGRKAQRETMRLVGFEDGGRGREPRDAGGL